MRRRRHDQRQFARVAHAEDQVDFLELGIDHRFGYAQHRGDFRARLGDADAARDGVLALGQAEQIMPGVRPTRPEKSSGARSSTRPIIIGTVATPNSA